MGTQSLYGKHSHADRRTHEEVLRGTTHGQAAKLPTHQPDATGKTRSKEQKQWLSKQANTKCSIAQLG